MMEQLKTSVLAIPSDTAVGPNAVMLVVPAGEGASSADLYRQFSGSSFICPANEQIVAIVSTGVLNTPDQVSATGRRPEHSSFVMDLEIHRFEGIMRANDPWVALVRMELGCLEPGTYQLVVHETEFRFSEMRRPERANRRATSKREMSFDCT
jgi:hypothetical protein